MLRSVGDRLFFAFAALYIFIAVNREISFFGIELRYLLTGLGLVCLFFSLCDLARIRSCHLSALEKCLFAYFALIALSLFMLPVSPLEIDWTGVINLVVVHALNLLAVVLAVIHRDLLRLRWVAKVVCVSGLVLGMSQAAVYVGIDMSLFLQNGDVRVIAADRGQHEHINLFGQLFRVSGFAEDPNYACLFNMIAIAMALLLVREDRLLAGIAIAFSLFGIAVAWSRTVVFGSLLVAGLIWIAFKLPRMKLSLLTAFPLLVAVAALLLPFLHIEVLQTMTTRYTLWLNAAEIFVQSPLLGNGLTAFRSYNALQQNGWYVHPHSSLWETLAEFGVVAFVLLIAIYILALRKAQGEALVAFCIAITVLFSVNFDVTYLQIGIVVFAFLPLAMQQEPHAHILCKEGYAMLRGVPSVADWASKRSERSLVRGGYPSAAEVSDAKSALFFINSFTGGGAERVCFDLIAESSKNQDVKVVVLDGRADYGALPECCEILDLDIDPSLSSVGRICAILLARDRINGFVGDIEQYDQISAHLNMSHLAASISAAASRALYVMHGAQVAQDPRRTLRHRLALRAFYKNKQIVCVSKGIESELVELYGFDREACVTIHNPLDLDRIDCLKDERIPDIPTDRYILAVGRLNKIKRFDRLIDLFGMGGFDSDMKLVILGTGDEEDAIRQRVREAGLERCVLLPGFTANPYAWMGRCSAYVCCSDSEAFPVGLVEALYCGAHVVAADCDYGPREILTGDLARYLVDPIDDISRYIEAVKAALEWYPKLDPAAFEGYRTGSIVDAYKRRWAEVFG